MRAEIGAAKLDWKLTTIWHIIERYPGDMMFCGVWMRYLLAYGDFNIKGNARCDGRRCCDDWRVLFSFPVGGFDVVGYAHVQVGVPRYIIEDK